MNLKQAQMSLFSGIQLSMKHTEYLEFLYHIWVPIKDSMYNPQETVDIFGSYPSVSLLQHFIIISIIISCKLQC